MQIERISHRRLPVIATFMIFFCALCTTGAFASSISFQGTGTNLISDTSLANTGWHLISYDNGNSLVSVADGSEITLKFNEDGSIGGSGGINLYFGSYTQTGNMVKFGTIGSTMMAGPEPLMDQESTFFLLIDSARAFHNAGSTLELSDATGRVLLMFEADNPGKTNNSGGKSPAMVLPGTKWQLLSYSLNNAVVSGTDVSTITLIFDDAGNLSGFGGVNRYFGSFNQEGNAIAIGPIGSTRMAGPEPLMTLETVYFVLLESATAVSVTGNSLNLADVSGNTLLIFEPQGTVSQSKYPVFPLHGSSHSVFPHITGGQSSPAITDRFHKAYNRSISTTGAQTGLLYTGIGIVTKPTVGTQQRPSLMPRLNDSITPPVSYPGGPLY
ncbi:MAG: META domain-containing protein [Methanomicrobiales archaeon]